MQFRSQILFTFLACIAYCANSFGQEPKRYYLGVGVEDYEHEILRKPAPLKYCVEDVTALGEFLRSQGYDVTLMTDETGKENARLAPTKTNVDAAIKALLEKGKRGDTVIIALAGHGLQFAGKSEAFFCPADAKPFASKIETLIPASRIYGEMEASFATSKVLLVDACRNDPDPTRGRGFDPGTAPPPKGIAVYFSCDAGQKALENDDLKHGVFFHYVLEGLSGRAKDDDNEVTLNTLANYVSKQVTRKVKAIQPNQPQQPNLRFEQVGESPVLVTVAATKIAESKPEMKPEMKKEPTDSEKKMPSDSLTKSRSAGDVQEFTDMKIKFCFCPPGKFLMGSPSDEKDRSDDEDDTEGDGGSQVEVTLTKGFWLGQTEVTQQQWFDVMGTRPWRNEDGSLQQYVKEGDDIAASYISHNKAMEYCDRITERERSAGRLKGNERYSLPSEAQWEYACRAGTKTQFSFGEDESSIGDYAWFMSLEGKHPHEVGRKKPNPWKFYDLHGNCCEWCLDVYHRELEGGIDPHSSDRSEDSKFVLRGGHWGCHQRLLRSAYRSVAFPARFLSYDSGFRLCRID